MSRSCWRADVVYTLILVFGVTFLSAFYYFAMNHIIETHTRVTYYGGNLTQCPLVVPRSPYLSADPYPLC